MSKIHRNDPCPCGSGKKYKQCCLPAEQARARARAARRELVGRITAWLGEAHADDVRRWVKEVWFNGVDEDLRRGLATTDPAIRRIHDVNVWEYMVTAGRFGEGGQARPVLDLVLDSALALTDDERQWLRRLARAPLRLYRVERAEPGQGFWLAPHPEGGEAVFIEDRWVSRMLDEGDVAGMRLVEHMGAWDTSGAVYFIPAEHVASLAGDLEGLDDDAAGRLLIRRWIELAAAHV